jgi:hypothetical protein
VHLVGLYEGAAAPGPARRFGNAAVSVEAADRPVILVLSAYESIRWTVRAARNAKIEKVILTGYYEQELQGAPAGVVVEKRSREREKDPGAFAVYRREHEAMPRAVRSVKDWTGMEIATFLGEYRFEGVDLQSFTYSADEDLGRAAGETAASASTASTPTAKQPVSPRSPTPWAATMRAAA